jgi:hypothetical protein
LRGGILLGRRNVELDISQEEMLVKTGTQQN